MNSPYVPQKCKVTEYFRESSDNFSIIVDFKCNHDPGQYVMVSLPTIGEAPISICSYSKDHLKLNIREVGTVTLALGKLKVGDDIWIRGPYGKGYPMASLEGNNVLMIGGGCGVAPLKGIVDYIQQYRSKYKDVDLFFGYRSVHDVLFTREVELWKKDFNLMLSIDQAEKSTNSCYEAKVGFVTSHLEKYNITNENRIVFVCGPPKMMEIAINILKNKGFHSDQIFISSERLMQCSIGKCGHCMIRGKYVCTDGPVFRYDEIENCKND